MKSFSAYAVAFATLLSLASASPISSSQLVAQNDPPTTVEVILRGATPEAYYVVNVPLDAPSDKPTSTGRPQAPTYPGQSPART